MAAHEMPEVYKHVLVGRIVKKIVDGKVIEGEVQGYRTIDAIEPENGPFHIKAVYDVMWRQRAPAGSSHKWVMEVMGEEEVKAIAIDRFCERSWMSPTIIHLQRAGWDPSKVNALDRDYEETVSQALRFTTCARKAALHAHAMQAALEGRELEIPAIPGPAAGKCPMVTSPHDYDAFCGKQKEQLPPIAWALPEGSEGRRFTMKEMRQGCKAASEVEALCEWQKAQNGQLTKLRKRADNRARLRERKERLRKLQVSLAIWDQSSKAVEVFKSVAKWTGKGAIAKLNVIDTTDPMTKEDIEKEIPEVRKQIDTLITACDTGITDWEAADAAAKKDIEIKAAEIARTMELLAVADQNLKEWVATAGLVKVKPGSGGVPAAQPKPRKAAAQPRKRSPGKKENVFAGANGAVKKAQVAPAGKAPPKKAASSAAAPTKAALTKAVPAKAAAALDKARKVASPVKILKPGGDSRDSEDLHSESDSDVSMEDVLPSARDELFWAGEELVRVKDKFYPKRFVFAEGDMPLSEWVLKEEKGELPAEEYLVDAILAERRRSKKREFIAKWKGFELHAEQWLPEDDFTDCMAVDEWEARCKAYRKKK